MDACWLPLERVAGAAAVLSDLRWLEVTLAAFEFARAAGVPTLLDADLGGAGALAIPGLTDYAIFSRPHSTPLRRRETTPRGWPASWAWA
jgi:sulfofructose kinase